eukprot:312199-Prymnesium_polylepis.1
MLGGVSGLGACGRGVVRKVENRLTVLLEHLAREDLREDVSRVTVIAVGTSSTVTIPAPRISHVLNILRSTCREF